jgi:hypothetical protein
MIKVQNIDHYKMKERERASTLSKTINILVLFNYPITVSLV